MSERKQPNPNQLVALFRLDPETDLACKAIYAIVKRGDANRVTDDPRAAWDAERGWGVAMCSAYQSDWFEERNEVMETLLEENNVRVLDSLDLRQGVV